MNVQRVKYNLIAGLKEELLLKHPGCVIFSYSEKGWKHMGVWGNEENESDEGAYALNQSDQI